MILHCTDVVHLPPVHPERQLFVDLNPSQHSYLRTLHAWGATETKKGKRIRFGSTRGQTVWKYSNSRVPSASLLLHVVVQAALPVRVPSVAGQHLLERAYVGPGKIKGWAVCDGVSIGKRAKLDGRANAYRGNCSNYSDTYLFLTDVMYVCERRIKNAFKSFLVVHRGGFFSINNICIGNAATGYECARVHAYGIYFYNEFRKQF